jgi:tetratricopeptide (TPR) repeat protein
MHSICNALPGFPKELLSQSPTLFKLGADVAEQALESAISEVVQDQKIILVIENLDLVFQEIGKDGQKKFRALLQNTGTIIVLASARYIVPAFSSYSAPFYGFFEIHHLKSLSIQESQEFLWKLAILNGNQAVQRLLKSPEGVGKVKAIHYLANGNPRVFMHFYDVLATTDSVQSFINPVLKVIDDLMPSYQSKMLQLSPQQRKIIEVLADSSTAMTVKAIADGVLITQQSASSQLRELKLKHLVGSTASGRESYYDLKDPLFKLCIQLKNNKVGFVNSLLSLLEAWFSASDLKQGFGQLSSEDGGNLLFKTLAEHYGKRQQRQNSQGLAWAENNLMTDLELSQKVEQFTKLKTLLETNNWAEALKVTQDLVAKLPTDSDLLKVKGTITFFMGKPEETLKSLESIKLDEPDDIAFLNMLGYAYGQIGRYEEALSSFNRALKFDANNVNAHLGVAKAHLGNEDYRLAIKSAQIVLNQEAMHVEALAIVAESYLELEQYTEATKYLNLAKSSDLNSYETKLLESKVRFVEGRVSESLEILDQIIAEAANSSVKAVAFSKKGWQLLSLKEHRKAVSAFIQAVRLDPDCPLYWQWLGEALDTSGHFGFAVACYDKLLSKDNKNRSALFRKGVSQGKLGNYQKSIETFEQLRLLDDGPQVTHNIGIAYMQQGNFEAALQQFSALPKDYGGRPIICCKANCLIELGKPNVAEKLLKGVEFEEFELNDVQSLRARIAAAKNEWQLAYELSKPLAASDRYALGVLIESLEQLDRHEEALEILRMMPQTSESSDLLQRKGWLEYGLIKFEDAKNSFDLALSIDPESVIAFLGFISASLQGKFYKGVVTQFKKWKTAKRLSEHVENGLSMALLSVAQCVYYDIEDEVESKNILRCIEELELAGLAEKHTLGAKVILILYSAGLQIAVNKAISNLKTIPSAQIQAIAYRFVLSAIATNSVDLLAPFLAALNDKGLMKELGFACQEVIIDWLESMNDVERAMDCVKTMTELCDTYDIDMERPLRICRTIIEFLQTKDEKLLVQIPIEERSLIQHWLKTLPERESLTEIF